MNSRQADKVLMKEDGRTVRQSDLAFQTIHQAIVRCDLVPGTIVTEQQLAERYGLKRAATRMALERLVMLKLLHPTRRLGYAIRPITLRDVIDSTQVLEVLLLGACRMGKGRVDATELRRYDQICSEGYNVKDSDSVSRFLEAECGIFRSIAKATGNVQLVAILDQHLSAIMRQFHFGLRLGGERDVEMGHQHVELIEALIDSDLKTAEATLKSHLARASALVLKTLMSSDALLDVSISVE